MPGVGRCARKAGEELRWVKLLGGGMGELGATGWLFEFGKLRAEAWSLQGLEVVGEHLAWIHSLTAAGGQLSLVLIYTFVYQILPVP